MELIALLIVFVMLVAALCVLLLRNMIAALVATSVVSLAVSVIFVLLRAPDVAMTEAAVGAGLSSLILALGLRRLDLWRLESPGENLLARHKNPMRQIDHDAVPVTGSVEEMKNG
jgi:energy-converting hydrogenase B subunit D